MTQSNSPLPGGGTGTSSTEDALAFLSKLWNPLGFPMPGFAMPATAAPGAAPAGGGMGVGLPSPASMFATLDPAEIERKIGELRVIENWLQMSLNFMQMSIKTMELQKASLEALRGPSTSSVARAAEASARDQEHANATRRKRQRDK